MYYDDYNTDDQNSVKNCVKDERIESKSLLLKEIDKKSGQTGAAALKSRKNPSPKLRSN